MIVIGIIGIIADMTIPSLIKKYEKLVLVTQLQKSVSVFTQGMRMIMAEEGVSEIDHTSLFGGTDLYKEPRKTAIYNAINKAFRTTKICKYGDVKLCPPLKYKYLGWSGDLEKFGGTDGYVFQTADGMLFTMNLDSYDRGCDREGNIGDCGGVQIDVNGTKKPNIFGRDLFGFRINVDGSIYPVGGVMQKKFYNAYPTWRDKPTMCGKEGSSDITNVEGSGCAARIIENGWKMDY